MKGEVLLPYEGTLSYMKINHGGCDIGMAGQLFQGNDVQPLLKQVGDIRVPQRMQVHLFVHHMFKTALRGRSGITRQCSQVFIDLFGINLLGQLAEMNDKKGNSADEVL